MKPTAKLVIAAVALIGGIVGGYAWKDVTAGNVPDLSGLASAVRGERQNKGELTPTRAVAEAMSAIDSVFYGTPTRQDLTYDAVAGMLASLEDPHTMLMEPELAQRFEEKNTGH